MAGAGTSSVGSPTTRSSWWYKFVCTTYYVVPRFRYCCDGESVNDMPRASVELAKKLAGEPLLLAQLLGTYAAYRYK